MQQPVRDRVRGGDLLTVPDESLEGYIFDACSMQVPAFCLAGIARTFRDQEYDDQQKQQQQMMMSKTYEDGEPGGYSIYGCVVLKALALEHVENPSSFRASVKGPDGKTDVVLDARSLVGTSIRNVFDGKTYTGTVTSVWKQGWKRTSSQDGDDDGGAGADATIYLHVEYDDGDEEDMDLEEHAKMEKIDSVHGGTVLQEESTFIHPLNVQSILKPFQLDTRKCPVLAMDAADNRMYKPSQFQDASAEFNAGECTAGRRYKIEYARMENGGSIKGKELIYLKDAWLSFGDGVPDNDMHRVNNQAKNRNGGGRVLPPDSSNLLLVRDLLVQCKMIGSSSSPLVGMFVLYSGKHGSAALLAALPPGAKLSWLDGIVISQHAGGGGGGSSMCEVLYSNGWVIWHASESFKDLDDDQILDDESNLILVRQGGWRRLLAAKQLLQSLSSSGRGRRLRGRGSSIGDDAALQDEGCKASAELWARSRFENGISLAAGGKSRMMSLRRRANRNAGAGGAAAADSAAPPVTYGSVVDDMQRIYNDS